jgi:hypothetical protein
MINTIKTLSAAELVLIAGGVTESPDGKSCTEHDDVFGKPTGSDEWGGPLALDLNTESPF